MNEKYNTNDQELAFETGMQFLDETFRGDGIHTEIISLGNKLAHHSRDTFTTLAMLTDSAVMASHEVEDKRNSTAAQSAFLKGTMTGLYVAKELLGDHLTPEAVISSIQTLGSKDDRGIVSNVGLMQEGEKLLTQMRPKTRAILGRWAAACDGSGEYESLYKLGFGLTMGGANKAMHEINLIKQLEDMSDWSVPAELNGGYYLESMDEDCMGLARSFETHATAVDLSNAPENEVVDRLVQVAKLLERDFCELKELRIDDRLQTRGSGLFIDFDQQGRPDGVFILDDDICIRGTLIGAECLPVPTDYALITQVMDDKSLYEPLVCLLLENVETVDSDGDIAEHDGVVALPLRVDGVHVDRLVSGLEQK